MKVAFVSLVPEKQRLESVCSFVNTALQESISFSSWLSHVLLLLQEAQRGVCVDRYTDQGQATGAEAELEPQRLH